jgi:hypothetical protein
MSHDKMGNPMTRIEAIEIVKNAIHDHSYASFDLAPESVLLEGNFATEQIKAVMVLLEKAMTKDEAKAILENAPAHYGTLPWTSFENAPQTVQLDGHYTIQELEAILVLMLSKSEN